MSDKWYYMHAGAVHGPVPAAQLHRLAATGGLAPQDLIWPHSVDPVGAIPAEAALSFPPQAAAKIPIAMPVRSPLPEWVRALTQAGLGIRDLEALPKPRADQWLEDVRRAEESSRTPEGKQGQ